MMLFFSHLLRFILQMYFLNLMQAVNKCSKSSSTIDLIVFNGHLISMTLPLFARLRPEIGMAPNFFDLALVICSAVYMKGVWDEEVSKTCDDVHQTGVNGYLLYYMISSLVGIMALGIWVQSLQTSPPMV